MHPINCHPFNSSDWFDKDIKSYIPISVINLTLKGTFTSRYYKSHSNNITHLTLPKGYSYNNLNNKCQVSF